MPTNKLIHTGSVIVDISMTVDAIPTPGGDVVASDSIIQPGGGLNTMVAAQRDGCDVLFAGRYGTGPFGDIVRNALEQSAVDILLPPVPGNDSGFCIAAVDATAERTFLSSVGAEGDLSLADLTACDPQPGDVVYVSGYSLATTVTADALRTWLPSLRSDVHVFVDPSPLIDTLQRELFTPLFDRADVLSCNAREARLLTGIDDLDAAIIVLAHLLRPGARVLLRDGARECRIATSIAVSAAPPAIDTVASFDVVAIDTNGAGDAHAGVFIAAWLRGATIVEATQRANAAAALAVTRSGPATAPTADETTEFLRARLPRTAL